MAEGSVGEARDPSNRLTGRYTANMFAYSMWRTIGVKITSPIVTKMKAHSASNIVIENIDLPSVLMRECNNVPPTEKVMNERAMFVMRSVWNTKSSGTMPNSPGFNSMPAKI